MRQRVVIAMALSCEPSVIIADEPTTALDVTVQAQILELLHKLRRNHGSAIVFITHDLDEALRIGANIAILKDGELVQIGTSEQILNEPADDYVRRFVEKRSRSPHTH